MIINMIELVPKLVACSLFHKICVVRNPEHKYPIDLQLCAGIHKHARGFVTIINRF